MVVYESFCKELLSMVQEKLIFIHLPNILLSLMLAIQMYQVWAKPQHGRGNEGIGLIE